MTAIIDTAGFTFNAASTTNSLSINKPANVTSGDLLIARLTTTVGETFSTPSGWTLLMTASSQAVFFYKFAGGSEASSYTFTKSASIGNFRGMIIRVQGAHPTTPFTLGTDTTTVSSSAPVSASVTGTFAAGLLVCFGCIINGANDMTAPSGMTTAISQYVQAGTNDEYVVATLGVGTGATGAKTWSIASGAPTSATSSFVINPSPAPDYLTHAFTTSASGLTIAVTAPSGLAVGDLAVLYLSDNSATTPTWTPPDGTWTLEGSSTHEAVFTHAASGSEPATWTFTRNGIAGVNKALAVRVTGHGSIGASEIITRGSKTTLAFASQSVSIPDSLLLSLALDFQGLASPYTSPGTVNEVADTADGLVGWGVVQPASTGTRTFTFTNSNVGGVQIVIAPPYTPPPSGFQRAAALYPLNTTTVDTGTGIDVRYLDDVQPGATDSSQSVRNATQASNSERCFDPGNTLDTTVTNAATTLSKKGFALLLADMAVVDTTNCLATLVAQTATIAWTGTATGTGAGNVGANDVLTPRASLWKYSPSTDTATLIVGGSGTAVTISALLAYTNTAYSASVSLSVPLTTFTTSEVLYLQIGGNVACGAGLLSGARTSTWTLEVDVSTTSLVFATQGLRQICTLSHSIAGESAVSREGLIAALLPRQIVGEGSITYVKAASVAKTFLLVGEGISSLIRDVSISRVVIGEGLASFSRAVLAAKSFDIAGEGIATQSASSLDLARSAIGEGAATIVKVAIVSKTFDLAGEGKVTEIHPVQAYRTFNLVGEALASMSRTVVASKTFNVVGEATTSHQKSVAVSLFVIGEGLSSATKAALISKTFEVIGEGFVTEVHPVQAYRTFTLAGEGYIVVSGPSGSTITIPLDELPTGEGGNIIVVKRPIYLIAD